MSQRILIVEDEIIVADDLEWQLKQLGYEVVGVATSGEQAVPLADREHPDIVLMDIRLQGAMTGPEAAWLIQRQTGAGHHLCHCLCPRLLSRPEPDAASRNMPEQALFGTSIEDRPGVGSATLIGTASILAARVALRNIDFRSHERSDWSSAARELPGHATIPSPPAPAKIPAMPPHCYAPHHVSYTPTSPVAAGPPAECSPSPPDSLAARRNIAA